MRFSDLLERLAPTPGLRRLRFVTSHPVDFTRDVLEAMRDLPAVCEFIHCPAQSGSDAMLQAMNRGYSRAQYDELVATAYEMMPDVAIASDFIVGFPGESQADHEASIDLIRQCRFKNSFIFKYSPRPGTLAARKLADDVPEKTKRARNADLLAAQHDAGAEHHRRFVGRSMEVLVSGPSPVARKVRPADRGETFELTGRTRGDHVVIFTGAEADIGRYVHVRVDRADSLTLYGTVNTIGAVSS